MGSRSTIEDALELVSRAKAGTIARDSSDKFLEQLLEEVAVWRHELVEELTRRTLEKTRMSILGARNVDADGSPLGFDRAQ